jgi:hypothetical protein
MSYSTLMNWEIALDIFGICCCVFSVFYLFKLKRKAASELRCANSSQPEQIVPFTENQLEISGNESFEAVLASARKIGQTVDLDARRKRSADPYDEVRRLLDLGVESDKIAERMNIPQCEIDMIASLRQMQPSAASDETG